MKIELFHDGGAEFPWGLLILWSLIWLGVLYRILTRGDFDTQTRILWLLVVIFVPFFGILFYGFITPSVEVSRAEREVGPIDLQSDVSGTPWAKNPHYTSDR